MLAVLVDAPAWIVAAFFLLAVLWILVAAIPALTAWSRTRNLCADRRRHFTALENAASSLSAQERTAAITEAMRIQDAPEPPAPESPPPTPGDQSNTP
ncbi:hypothetical protein [Embleya hyalina]|uniref:Uncharacterized protein n=1 Tax=Embleya hyalina TaxID=516124 RepID=A0A401Z3W1_9ACTN|nr:hypothetical protein [Embleya hyalina]GCE01534.1 hypothetical protein EHYA_09300 [Embleya hyalina]